jgi:3-oxoacyl-[acyl-carrier protein] reductase
MNVPAFIHDALLSRSRVSASSGSGNGLGPPSGPAPTALFPDLAGKTALVTGAARNIGRGIAEYLGRQRMRVVVCDRLGLEGGSCVQALRADGIDASFVCADLATPEGAAAAAAAAESLVGPIDVLVNNAAILQSSSLLDADAAMYESSFEANMRITWGITQAVARGMVAHRSGSIINISSVGGLRGHKGMVPYDAYKGAIDAFTRALAVELAPHGIRVNAIAPGAVARSEAELSDDQKRRFMPLARAARNSELGAAVTFFASACSAYTTGQVLYIDGGLTTQLSPPNTFV